MIHSQALCSSSLARQQEQPRDDRRIHFIALAIVSCLSSGREPVPAPRFAWPFIR